MRQSGSLARLVLRIEAREHIAGALVDEMDGAQVPFGMATKSIEPYIENAIDRFIADPPDTDFKRGYFEALIVIYRDAMGRNDERLNAALRSRVPLPPVLGT